MSFIISEQPFVYKEFLMYMQTIRGKSMGTISEYALDLNIFFKFMTRHFKIDNSKITKDEMFFMPYKLKNNTVIEFNNIKSSLYVGLSVINNGEFNLSQYELDLAKKLV